MTHIHNNTEKVKNDSSDFITEKKNVNTTSADQKAILGDKKPINKRKKTTRSGNSFIRPPKQNLLIMRHRVILRFD